MRDDRPTFEEVEKHYRDKAVEDEVSEHFTGLDKTGGSEKPGGGHFSARGSGVISVANADWDAPHRVHINRSLLREIADNAREAGFSPKWMILDKTGIPYNTIELATTMSDQDVRAMPNGPLRETFEALAHLLGEDVPLATREWLVDPQLHPRMLGWYTSLETLVRRQADKPGRKGDKGFDQAPAYDGRDDGEEAIDKFWVIPDAICLWKGFPSIELFKLEEMSSMYWDILRDPELQVKPKERLPRYLPFEGGWVPPARPGYSPALIPWKTLKGDAEWWMRLDRPSCQQWNFKLSKAVPSEKHLTGGMRQFVHVCVSHRKPIEVINAAPVADCPKCKRTMVTDSWDKLVGIARRNRGNQWDRMAKDISTLDWLQEMAQEERLANATLPEDQEPVWMFAQIYINTLKKWLGNTYVLELEQYADMSHFTGTFRNEYYHEMRRWTKATPTTEEERAEMRRKKKRVLHAHYEVIEEVLTQHERAKRAIRKVYSRRMENDLGIAWLPKWAAGELVPDIDAHVIDMAEKLGHSVEDFNPFATGPDTLTWAVKCYFGWSERELYRSRASSSSSGTGDDGWNTHADEPEQGQQRHDDTGAHQVFHDGYWVSFEEYRREVPARDLDELPWDLTDEELQHVS
jgi:hypothetical protein